MFKTLRKVFARLTSKRHSPRETQNNRIPYDDFRENPRCPKCGGDEFMIGPRGGLAFMIKCRCGQEFTVYPGMYVEMWG